MTKGRIISIAIALTFGCGLLVFWLRPDLFRAKATLSPTLTSTSQNSSENPSLDANANSSIKNGPAVQSASSPESKNLGVQPMSEKDIRQMAIFDEIMKSKNDNDPRMDKDLVGLSPAAKAALMRKYEDSPAELRNNRGTIALLIGRELSTPQDLEFLKTILAEPPCLSLENCRTPSAPGGDEHSQNGIGITLVYPQLVTLKMLESYLSHDGQNSLIMNQSAQDAILAARNSSNPILSSAASNVWDHVQKK
jgi:hypothetical protein